MSAEPLRDAGARRPAEPLDIDGFRLAPWELADGRADMERPRRPHDGAAPSVPPSTALWQEIRGLAQETARREPPLRPLLARTVLHHETPAGIAEAVLSRWLPAGLQGLVADTLSGDAAMLERLAEDIATACARDPACRSPLHALLHLKGLQALQLHRVAHRLWQAERRATAQAVAAAACERLAVDIHPAVPVGRRVLLDHATGVVVGETAVVEDDVTLLHGVTLGATGKHRGDRHPKVRRGATLGAGATVLGAIEVGAWSRVGAGSVVLDAVPAHATVVGAPARVVREEAAA